MYDYYEGYYGPKWWSFGVMLGSRGIAIFAHELRLRWHVIF
jgi:hypothetical protein